MGEELRTGQVFAQSDLELFRGLCMELSEIEDAVRHIFQSITITFSPHRPIQIRALELSNVLQRCGVDERRVSQVHLRLSRISLHDATGSRVPGALASETA